MAEGSNNKSYSPNRINTLIGAGMHFEGDISCTDVLRVQGTVLGNVVCDGSSIGTLVVDDTGAVTGTINVTHIVVRGRVTGPVKSSQSIEVHPGAAVVGDVSYKAIAIHAGGVVEGLLNPAAVMDGNGWVERDAPRVAASLAANELPMTPATGYRLVERFGGLGRIRLAVTLGIIIAAIAWMGRDLLVMNRPAGDAALRADSSPKDSIDLKPASAASGEAKNDLNVATGNTAPPATSSAVDTKDAAQPLPPDRPGTDQEKVLTVKGENPNRPAGVFLLICNEQSVLYRKKRDDPTNGDRISVSQGEKVSISFSPDDLFRVVEGKDMTIFYQGRKVSRNIIESGSWISFVPK